VHLERRSRDEGARRGWEGASHPGLPRRSPETSGAAPTGAPVTARHTEYSLWTRYPDSERGARTPCAARTIASSRTSPLGPASSPGSTARPTTSPTTTSAVTTAGSRGQLRPEPPSSSRAVEARRGSIAVTPGASLRSPWVLARGDDIVPIPGTKAGTYIEEPPLPSARSNLRRGALQQALREAFPLDAVAATR